MVNNKVDQAEINEFAKTKRLEAVTKVGEYIVDYVKDEATFKQVVFVCNVIFTLGYKAHKDELLLCGIPEDAVSELNRLQSDNDSKKQKIADLEGIITRLVEGGNQDAVREFIMYRNKNNNR